MAARVGMRVLRGPNWEGGDSDGGEGHLGTITALLDGGKVRVLWDNGKEGTYRTGADNKFELRIFDSAPVGVRHQDATCSACEEKGIYGMMWRCKNCRACNLCPLCYVTDKHDLRHEFLRYNEQDSSGEGVKKRSVSLKIRAMGIFPGAKVKRGRDWSWGDQDGGQGAIGEVTGFENVAPDSSRNIVRVQWPHGKTNSYRLGFQGNVDLMCVEEEAGTYYYRDHLPVVNTVGASTSPSSASSQPQDNSALFRTGGTAAASSTGSSGGATSSGASDPPEPSSVQVGDKVTIQVDEDKLKELQATCGGCTATMVNCIGKMGEVVSFAANGAVAVKFGTSKVSFRFNPKTLTKVPELKVGDMVRIRSDVEQVKVLNKRIKWTPGMDQALGKVGQITKIDSDGDVVVAFGNNAYMFSPACCEVVSAGATVDSFSSTTSSTGGDTSPRNDSSSSDTSDDYQDRLFKAIARGDTQAIRSICQNNRSLLNYVHKGLTPLMVAAHEGQRDAINVLLELGAEINRQGDKGNTPLGAALEGKKEQMALFLLEKGADPHVRNSKQRNPVHIAAYNNLPEAIKALALKGADVNAKDQFGDTPLHDAIEKGNQEAVDMLLRVKSIDLQATDRKNFNMLQYACLKGNAHATERILARDSGQVDKMLDGQYSALHIAANNDHVECVKLLGNANVNLVGHKGLTPLHLACIRGQFQSAEALVEFGADVNVADADGDTPLHVTVGTKVNNPDSLQGLNEQRQRARLACILLSKGAYPDATNKKGRAPLECCPHPALRKAVQEFINQNPSVIKKKGGARVASGAAGARRMAGTTALEVLMQGMSLPCGGCMGPSDITLMPCGHKTLCRNCCLKTSECPLCDATIERRLHKRSEGGTVIGSSVILISSNIEIFCAEQSVKVCLTGSDNLGMDDT
ncbi:hypothetical protein BaRGS_00035915 [Batillaria attramentaria]|uniref:RING-type E3 ubiquitin transferase n=1 Tax=Batillaria attramentaria TaxID=370345 RepID=A0ABD0JD21_9CAEN